MNIGTSYFIWFRKYWQFHMVHLNTESPNELINIRDNEIMDVNTTQSIHSALWGSCSCSYPLFIQSPQHRPLLQTFLSAQGSCCSDSHLRKNFLISYSSPDTVLFFCTLLQHFLKEWFPFPMSSYFPFLPRFTPSGRPSINIFSSRPSITCRFIFLYSALLPTPSF